tara:strand:- start:592 stop:2724 length:2133 start_codon:yes stop_codon:yes gene_type:complete
MLNNWYKKEKPFAGFAGFGGGATGLGFAGGGSGIVATGGIKYWKSSENGGTMYHIFQSPGTFNVTNDGNVEVLIVGGGGSGADGQAGGGGGGGVVHGPTIPVSDGSTIPIVVGAGGEPNGPGGYYGRCGYRGGSSSFDGVTAIGGGGGAKNNYAWGGMSTDEQNRVSGANCGGGGGGSLSGSGEHFPSAAIISQPVPGSYVAYGGNYGAPASTVGGGSGGGGGGAGANSPGPAAPRGVNVGSPGGAGKAIPSFNSTNIPIMPSSWITAVGPTGLYGGGGGGGEDGPGGSGLGGPGGGGHGQSPSSYPNSAVVFTGGGGGDRGEPSLPHEGTAGAKGVVIVKYQSALTSDVGSTFGGEHFIIGNYTYHVFSAGESALAITSGPVTYDILVVAGGGAGGSDRAAGASGGGGGGGVIYAENQTMGVGTYNVFVGSGGAYQPGGPSSPKGDNGGNSLFSNATIPGSAKTNMSGHSMPATTWFALGGGGGAGSGPGNANLQGREAGTGGGGGSNTGSGGGATQTTQSSLPSISRNYGSGTSGRSSGSYPARGGGGGGHSPNTYGQGNQLQGGHNGYQVPHSFLPSNAPASFANLLGANHPTAKGGGISKTSPEWHYFAGGGGASDNVPATNDIFHGSGGLGGGGNAGGEGRTSPSNPRTAFTGNTFHGVGNEASPGVHGRGGGGAGNGLDHAGSSVDYFGGTGGDGIIIVRVHNS